jgi:hypothetical protein
MGIRLLPVDEAGRRVNALEISTMTKDGSGNFAIVQSGGTESNVQTTHAAYDTWNEIYEAGWRYDKTAEVPETARTV